MKRVLLIATLMILPAQASAESITLNQVIKESLHKNTAMFQAQQKYEDKLTDATKIKLLENPEFSVYSKRTKGNAETDTEFEISQSLKLSQISGSRYDYARELSAVADAEQKYEILKIINETTALYTQLWLLAERNKLYKIFADDALKIKKLINISAKQGQTSPAVSYLFDADAAKLRADSMAIEAKLRQVRTELARFTGKNYALTKLQKPSFSTVPKNTQRLFNFAQSQSNVRTLLKMKIQTAERGLLVAHQDTIFPEIKPRLTYARPVNDGESYGVGIALRIPLWNQNDVENKRAHSELKYLRSEDKLLSDIPQKEVISELQQSAISLQVRSDNYSRTILPGYRKSYKLTQEMLRQGQADALTLWQVREKLLTSEKEALDAIAEAINSRGTLELELGGKLEEIQ